MNLGPKPRVAVVYDGFPHYRKGIIEELAASDRYDYYFFGDSSYRAASIRTYDFAPGMNFTRTGGISLGPVYIQTNIFKGLIRHNIAHCIFLGNPWFVSYWMLVPILRLLGKRVYFWSHGWISAREPLIRGTIKHRFFRLSDALLLYGARSKKIGTAHGYPPERMHVINNSLDYGNQKALFEGLQAQSRDALRDEFRLPRHSKIIICTARVTEKCRFDILMHAARRLKSDSHDVFLVIVGDGPEKEALAALATSLGVAHRFWGACYDETTLAKLYKAADLTVSPGKVGLTALHSMAYGTPVISHDNLDHQMPECEAIVPGLTGDFFVENSSEDLARVILKWFDAHATKPERECVERIEAEFTPAFQRRAIENALDGRMKRP